MSIYLYERDYYGFVYIWRDRKHGKYYLGSHMGSLNDGYVCSSKVMNRAFKRRPLDFKRRILYYVKTSDRKTLLEEEGRWLAMTRPEELRKKYYNIVNRASGWKDYERMKLFMGSTERKRQSSEASKRYWSDPVNRKKQAARKLGKKNPAHSERMRAKWADPDFKKKFDRSESNRKAWANDVERRERQRQSAAKAREALARKRALNRGSCA